LLEEDVEQAAQLFRALGAASGHPFGDLREPGDVGEEDRGGEALGRGRGERRGVRRDAARDPRGDVTGERVEKRGRSRHPVRAGGRSNGRCVEVWLNGGTRLPASKRGIATRWWLI
jgi:hypothetical protein